MPVLKNAKHERFVQNVIAGMSQRQAYREVYPRSAKWKDESVDQNASKLFAKLEPRYQELLEEQKTDALLTRWEKRKLLADIARDKEMSSTDRIRAIDTDNKMESEYTQKVEVSSLDTEKSKLDDLISQMMGG